MTTETHSLDEHRRACAGQPFRALVELHAVRHDAGALAAQIRAVRREFRAGTGRCAERLYNVWNRRGQRQEVLELDCREAMDRVVADARRRLPEGTEEDVLIRAFRLVTLGLALTASLFPEARRAMGVRTASELVADPGGREE